MANTYSWQTAAELRMVDQTMMAQLTQNNPIFDLFPIRETNAAMVVWEQRDDYLGLMQIRGYNGQPPSVPHVGTKRYIKTPGVYGEFDAIDELELTTRAAPGTFTQNISIDDLVSERLEKLMTRQVNRQAWVLWTLLSTGVYTVLDAKGAIVDQDSYTPQGFAASVTWATSATATPLADFRAVQLLSRGASVTFGPRAKAFMNQATFNSLIGNTNAADLGGRRTEGLASIEGLAAANELTTRDNLPTIVVYDEGYKDDTNTFNLWIPNNKVIVVGARSNGASVGEFLLTRNAQNPGFGSAPYQEVVDSARVNGNRPPRSIEVHRGMNGGPAVYYPGSVVVMTV